jgi:uncharacterized membrane protein (UPF0182 family)
VVAGVLVVLVWTAGGLARFYLDLLWFGEVGKTQVFWGVLGAEVGLGLLTGLGTAVIVGGNLWVAQRIAAPDRLLLAAGPQTERLRVLLLPRLVVWFVSSCVVVMRPAQDAHAPPGGAAAARGPIG